MKTITQNLKVSLQSKHNGTITNIDCGILVQYNDQQNVLQVTQTTEDLVKWLNK